MKRNAKNVATTVVIVREQNDDENHAITAYMIILHSETTYVGCLLGGEDHLGMLWDTTVWPLDQLLIGSAWGHHAWCCTKMNLYIGSALGNHLIK